MSSKKKQTIWEANSRQAYAEQKGGEHMSPAEVAEQHGFQEFYSTKIDKDTVAKYFQKPESNEYLEIDISKNDGQIEWVYFVEHDGEAVEIVGHGHQSYSLERILTKGWRSNPVLVSEEAKLREHIQELERFIQECEDKLRDGLYGVEETGKCGGCKQVSKLDKSGFCYKC